MAVLGKILLIPKGDYSPTEQYVILDYVRYNKATWVCKQTCTGVEPVDGDYWQLLAEDGVNGTDGEDGEDGTDGVGIAKIDVVDAGKDHIITITLTDPLAQPITFTVRDGADPAGGGDMYMRTYDKNENGTVDFAEGLIDDTTKKVGDVPTLVNLSDDYDASTGEHTLKFYGKEIKGGGGSDITKMHRADYEREKATLPAGYYAIDDDTTPGGGASSWIDLSGKPFETVGTDFAVSDDTLKLANSVKNSLVERLTDSTKGYGVINSAVKDGKVAKLQVDTTGEVRTSVYNTTTGQWEKVDSITAKLPTTAPTAQKAGQAPVIQPNGTVDWGEVKGGHDMISTSVDDVTSNTEPNKVVDAVLVKEYSNRYTERVILTLKAEENTIGEWQDTERENWVVDENHFVIIPQFYEADDEDLEINILFDTILCEPMYLYGWQWVSDTGTTKQGKPCGGLCIRCGNAPSEDVRVVVDITRVRYDNVVVVPTT